MKHAIPINTHAAQIKAWADRVFPNRTDQAMYLKLYGEIAEMIDAPPDEVAGEVADVFIMLLDFAARRGIDVEEAIISKMATNINRQWALGPNGTFQHVK